MQLTKQFSMVLLYRDLNCRTRGYLAGNTGGEQVQSLKLLSTLITLSLRSLTSCPCEGAAVGEEVVRVQPGMVSSLRHENGAPIVSAYDVVFTPLSFDPRLLPDRVELHSFVNSKRVARIHIYESTRRKIQMQSTQCLEGITHCPCVGWMNCSRNAAKRRFRPTKQTPDDSGFETMRRSGKCLLARSRTWLLSIPPTGNTTLPRR